MTTVDDRYEQFLAYLEAGSTGSGIDPFEGLDDSERAELATRLEAFADQWLNSSPDPESIERAKASDPRLERLRRSIEGDSGVWPSMLPRLREREGLGRDELAHRLAEDLGSADAEKVRRYYHRMEWGRLPAPGVSGTVLDSLGRILDVDPEELRTSGVQPARGSSSTQRRNNPAKTFARFIGGNVTPGPASAADDTPAESDWDDTDRLFIGG